MSRQNGHISEQVRTHISNCVQLVSLFDSSVISIKYEQAEVSVKRFMSQCKLVMQHPLWSCPLTVIEYRVFLLHTDDDNLILTDDSMWILRGETWTIFFENSSHDETAVHADCFLLEYVYVNEQTVRAGCLSFSHWYIRKFLCHSHLQTTRRPGVKRNRQWHLCINLQSHDRTLMRVQRIISQLSVFL